MELFCFELEAGQWEALQEELARADHLRVLTLARCQGLPANQPLA